MKRLLVYLITLLSVSACMIDVDRVDDTVTDDSPFNGESVTVTFSVPNIKIAPSTKTQADITEPAALDPDNFFVVVCGSNQSIKYVRKAQIISSEQKTIKQINDENTLDGYPLPFPNNPDDPDDPDNDPTGEHTYVTLYTFTVQLEISDKPRTIHFLGNVNKDQLITGSYAYDILPFLLSNENKQAFWQKVVVPSINPQEGADGKPIPYVDHQGNPTNSYKPDPDCLKYLKYVPLIRNYAEIHLTNKDPNFLLHSYSVIYFPRQGTVVPYRTNTSSQDQKFDFKTSSLPSNYRLSGYEKCDFPTLEDVIKYPGNLPSGVPFNYDVPTESDFITPDNIKVLSSSSTKSFYVYERGVPTKTLDATYIILCGRMKKSNVPDDVIDPVNDKLYYYRLDLMETKEVIDEDTGKKTTVAQYYPIYRNFRYDIQIKKVSKAGVDFVRLAVESSGADDISQDPSMRYLGDISNGQSRLVVEPYMSWTYTGPSEDGYYELYARFYNDDESDVPNTRPTAVQVSLEDIEGGDIIELVNDNGIPVRAFYPRAQSRVDASGNTTDGWRIIRFNLVEATDVARTQNIRITGWNDEYDEQYPLYRDVEITLQKKQDMTVTCSQSVVPSVSGEKQTVAITIPAGLPESMFPIKFIIEAEDMTLTPDTDWTLHPDKLEGYNLPVQNGTSISDNQPYKDKTTFQYIRTLTLDEYNNNYVELVPGSGQRTFYCYFKTNRKASATTIWVWDENKYFNKKSVSFTNPVKPPEVLGHFYVEAIEDCMVKLSGSGVEIKIAHKDATDEQLLGMEFQDYSSGSYLTLQAGYRVYFRSSDNVKDWSTDKKFYCTAEGSTNNTKDGKFNVGGNIASLIIGDGIATAGSAAGITGARFDDFLKSHTNLIDAYYLELPMTSLPERGYQSLFQGCTNLKRGPRELPATNLGTQSYRGMFRDCPELETVPDLPATTIQSKSYQMMFNGCSKVTSIKMNSSNYIKTCFISAKSQWDPADDEIPGRFWLGGVATSGTIYLNPALESLTSEQIGNIVPSDWTIKRYDGSDWQGNLPPTP